MEDEEYRNKLLSDLQIYIPFLESMIQNLQNVAKTQEKPRSAQLDKMKSLLDLLTNRNRKMKIATLKKCEEVLSKLHQKMNGSNKSHTSSSSAKSTKLESLQHTSDHESSRSSCDSPLSAALISRLNVKNDSAPASPSPPLFQMNRCTPIIIPTERIISSDAISENISSIGVSDPIPCSQDAEDDHILLYTRRQRSPVDEHNLFRRRSRSPSKCTYKSSHTPPLNISSDADHAVNDNEWRNLTDDEDDITQRRGTSHTADAPLVRRSVFARLGKKLSTESDVAIGSSCNAMIPSPSRINKIPKSAAVITNITNQIKARIMEQNIASEIAGYISESEKNSMKPSRDDTASAVSKDKGSPITDVGHIANSCGIRKSTPSLKLQPARKLQDAGIFGDVLSSIDKKLIGQVNKSSKRKSVDGKHKKDVEVAEEREGICDSKSVTDKVRKDIKASNEVKKDEITVKGAQCLGKDVARSAISKKNHAVLDIDLKKDENMKKPEMKNQATNAVVVSAQKDHSSSILKESSHGDFAYRTDIEKSLAKKDTRKEIDSRVPQINANKSNTPSGIYERLSDKYPRKKIADTSCIENTAKPVMQMARDKSIPPIKDIILSPIMERVKTPSPSKNASNFQNTPVDDIRIIVDKDPNKITNIPDIKPNDPRVRNLRKSPTRDGPQFMDPDMEAQRFLDQSNQQFNLGFPSIVDMDYRYITNRATPMQQSNRFLSNNNFLPGQTITQHNNSFPRKPFRQPLLPTPTFGYSNMNDCVNGSPSNAYASPNFIENRPSDRYNHLPNDARRRSIDVDKVAYNTCEYNYSSTQTYNSRGRGNIRGVSSGYNRRGSFRWSKESSRNDDCRQNSRADLLDAVKDVKSTPSPLRSPNTDIPKSQVEPPKNDHKKILNDTNDVRSSHASIRRTAETDHKLRKKNEFKKNNERYSYDSRTESDNKNMSSATSSAIKSYKIPKIKRDVPQHSADDHKDAKTSGKEKNDREIDKATTNNSMLDKQNSAQTPSTEGDTLATDRTSDVGNLERKDSETASSEQSAMLSKMFELITKVCTGNKAVRDDEQLNVLQKLRETIDPKKFEKIQKILDADSDREDGNTTTPSEMDSPIVKKSKKRVKIIESDSSDEEAIMRSSDTAEKTSTTTVPVVEVKKTKRRNALEMLQHDVRDMFISEGVLTATGLRMCRALKEDCCSSTMTLAKKEETKTKETKNVGVSRKCRSNGKKIDYCEDHDKSFSTDSITSEEEDSTKDSVIPPIPRIVLEKLNNGESKRSGEQSAVRGRNVARRGRASGFRLSRVDSCKDAPTEPTENFSEESLQAEPDAAKVSAVSNAKKLNPKKYKKARLFNMKRKKRQLVVKKPKSLGISNENNEIDDNTLEKTERVSPRIMKFASRNNGSKLKKKLKRKSAWKMGILKGKKKTKKYHIVTKENEEIDTISNPTQMNSVLNDDKSYFLNGSDKYKCKLCPFAGKMITGHYLLNHPSSEVFISRLNSEEAEAAKSESEVGCDNGLAEMVNDFTCRFCDITLREKSAALMEHVSLHTGEYRYACNICNKQAAKLDNLRYHFKYLHKDRLAETSPIILYDTPNSAQSVDGYMCNYCNFTQIFEKKLERHTKDNHPTFNLSITKIPLYRISTSKNDNHQLRKDPNLRSGIDCSEIYNKTNRSSDRHEVRKNLSLKSDTGCLENYDVINSNNELTQVTISRKISAEISTILQVHKPSQEEISIKKNPQVFDKKPFLSNEYELPEFMSNETFVNTNSPFEPFTKKMTITDALKNKICSLTEKQGAEHVNVKVENKTQAASIHSVTTESEINSVLLSERLNIKTEKNNDDANKENVVEASINHDLPLVEAPEISNSESCEWDDPDSNDSERSRISNSIENVDEVLQNMKSFGKTSDVMSNTIQRLASNLITSPIKCNSIIRELISSRGLDESAQDAPPKTDNYDTSLPPSEPIMLNNELITNRKIQIGTIRASITPKNEIVYECFEKGCVFRSDIESTFVEHISNCHATSKWDGFCNICDKIVESVIGLSEGYSQSSCFQHLISMHKLDIARDENASDCKTFLKTRRLSGDTLSISRPEIEVMAPCSESTPNIDLEPFLKIESVVSLCTNFEVSSSKKTETKSDPFPAENDLTGGSNLPETPSVSTCGSGIEIIEVGRSIGEHSDTPIKGSVKPWLYNPNARKKSIETYTPEKLSHLFKCMRQTCTYTTDDRVVFHKHLISHNAGTREYTSAHRKCFACPYCNKMCENHLALSGHISEQHSHCRYQCGNCFYRSFSKINMKRHLETYHMDLCARNVIGLPLSVNETKEWELRNEGNADNVIPYRCYAEDCTFQTHCRFAYADHLKEPSNFACFTGSCNMCNKRYTTVPGFINHMKTHGLNNYQCCYCIFGCELESSVLDHLARLHPDMPASAFKRDSSGDIFQLRKLDLDVPESSTLPVAILSSAAEKEHGRQISNDEFSVELPRESAKESLNDVSYDSDCGVLIIDEPKSPECNELDVNQSSDITENHAVGSNQSVAIDIDNSRSKLNDSDIINKESNDNLVSNSDIPNTETFIYVEDLSNGSTKSNEFTASSVDPLSIDQDSSKNYTIVELANEDVKGNESFILASLLDKSGDRDNTSELLEIEKPDTKKGVMKTDPESSENETKDFITKDLLKYTGLGPDSLFKCAKCDVVFVYSAEYRTHITDCITDGAYKCAHCPKIFKYINILIDHMKMHGTHRYSCGLCDYRAARTTEVKIHMRHKHKFHKSEIYPADPCNAQPDLDLFICVPKVKEAVSNNLSSKTLNVFTPNDIDKLPRNSIYSFEVRCALCPFKTKVRSNIVRHLQQHKSESAVPHVCPVNKVPCLTSTERHFDKMTNLACSSHLNAPTDQNKSKATTGETVVKEQDDVELPIFVIDSKRFVCGISGCKYLTVNEEMLRHHYIALHINETSYACPHCVSEKFTGTINIEKIISHLRLHGERLYKCPKCAYHRSHRHIVERHIADKHPTSIDQVIVLRGDENISPKIQKKDAKVSKTWVCGLCDYSVPDRGEVINHTWDKHGTRSQYKCAHCNFRCSYKNSFMNHFSLRHKGQPLDIITVYKRVDIDVANSEQRQEQLRMIDTTPLWTREQSGQRHIRGILLEDEDLENIDTTVKSPEEKIKKLPTVSPVKKDVNVEILTNSGRRKRGSTTNYREYSDDELFYEYDKPLEKSTKKAKQKSPIVETKSKAKPDGHIPLESICNITESETCNSDTLISTVKQTGKCKSAVNIVKESSGEIILLSSSDEEDLLSDQPSNFISKSNLPPLLDEGNYGTPRDGKYCCPLCEEFCSTCEDEMCGHLYNELHYMKYSCDFCKCFSWEQSRLQKQCEQNHPNVVSVIHESPSDQTIESWVVSALQHQKSIIKEMIAPPADSSLEGDVYKTQGSSQPKDLTPTIEVTNSGETIYHCSECSYKTRSIGFFNRHKRSHMARRLSASQGSHKKDIGSPVEKKHSGKQALVTESNLALISNEKIKECSEIIIGEVSSSEVIDVDSKIDIKIDDDDGSQIIYVCHYCPKRGNTVAEIHTHWEITHKTPKFTSEGKIRGAWEFKYKTTTEQKLIERGAKIMPKNLFMCQYCGKKGHQKALQTHHRNSHGLLEMKIGMCSDKPPMFKCVLCNFIVYAESFMKRHFALTHVGQPVAYNKVTEGDIQAQSESIDEVKTYQCSYCVQKFSSLGDMSKHHDKFHSHKDMILKCGDSETESGAAYRRQLFKCPMCISAFVSYNHVCQHIEMHVKPFICGYCSDGFSLPDMAKLHIQRVHPGLDENCYTVVENTQAILQASIADIRVVLDNGLVLPRNMDAPNKKRLSMDDEGFGNLCKIQKVESLSGTLLADEPTIARRAVAKKSTTKLPPGNCRAQVAKKSTSKQSLNMFLNQIYNEEVPLKSFYNTRPLYDNSKINTVLTLGGKPMRVHIDSLETITNIHPKLPLIDVKLQQQEMGEEPKTT